MSSLAATETPATVNPFEIVEAHPSGALIGVIARVTGYRETGNGHLRQQQAASLVIPLIVSFGEPFAIGLGRPPTHNDRFGSFAAGLFAGPVVIESSGASHCIQIDFTPLGARRFFRMPMHELADRVVPLDEVLGPEGARLRERLGNAPDWQTRFDLAQRFVEARIAAAALPSGEIRAAFDAIAQTSGRIPIGRLASRVGWSRKHLANRFREEFGLGPKTIARIVRFDRALTLGRNGRSGLADIAADCGFADQAHLTREFRTLAGAPPSASRNASFA